MSKFVVVAGMIIMIGFVVLSCNNMSLKETGDNINDMKKEMTDDTESNITNDVENEKTIDIKKGELITFELYESYEVDTSGIREKFNIAENTPFTFFLQKTIFDNIAEYFIKSFYLEIPDIDFNYEDKYMAITIGRKLKEIRFNEFLGTPYIPNEIARVDITLSEEYYGQMMYVYVMDKIFLCGSLLDGNSFYIMKGNKKEFCGYNTIDLNEREPWGDEPGV